MVSPQAENGHVDIAHEIIEALAKFRLSGEEWQCLLVVIRKTYGWKKKDDEISLSQFVAMTGLKRQHVCRAINKLVPKKVLVTSPQKGTRSSTNYAFNKHYNEWIASPKKGTSTGGVVPIMVPKLVPKKGHTKETTKEKNLHAKKLRGISGDHSYFIAWWCHAFEVMENQPYVINKKETAHVKKILEGTKDLRAVVAKACQLLTTKEPFYENNRTLGILLNRINNFKMPNKSEYAFFRQIGIIPPEGIQIESWIDNLRQEAFDAVS